MKQETPPQGGEPVGERLARLSRFLDRTAREIERLYEDLEAGERPSEQTLKRELGELKRWAAMAFEEQERIDKLIGKRSGGDGAGYEIDFAAARASIGRRLDRLRAASGAGSVPE